MKHVMKRAARRRKGARNVSTPQHKNIENARQKKRREEEKEEEDRKKAAMTQEQQEELKAQEEGEKEKEKEKEKNRERVARCQKIPSRIFFGRRVYWERARERERARSFPPGRSPGAGGGYRECSRALLLCVNRTK